MAWYAGTMNTSLNGFVTQSGGQGEPIFRKLSDTDIQSDPSFSWLKDLNATLAKVGVSINVYVPFNDFNPSNPNPWYTGPQLTGLPNTSGIFVAGGNWEGLSNGFAYSPLGGVTPPPSAAFLPGDPNKKYDSIYNGGFEDGLMHRELPEIYASNRFPFSYEIPGWSFHGGSGFTFDTLQPAIGKVDISEAFVLETDPRTFFKSAFQKVFEKDIAPKIDEFVTKARTDFTGGFDKDDQPWVKKIIDQIKSLVHFPDKPGETVSGLVPTVLDKLLGGESDSAFMIGAPQALGPMVEAVSGGAAGNTADVVTSVINAVGNFTTITHNRLFVPPDTTGLKFEVFEPFVPDPTAKIKVTMALADPNAPQETLGTVTLPAAFFDKTTYTVGVPDQFKGKVVTFSLEYIPGDNHGFDSLISQLVFIDKVQFTNTDFHADLSVTKTADKTKLSMDEVVTYTVTVKDNGPADASGVQVKDLLPPGLTFVSAKPTVGKYDPTTGIWTVGNVKNGASATLTLLAKQTDCNSHTNTATVSSDGGLDTNSANDTASVTVDDKEADLVMTKTADNLAPNVGDVVTYTVQLTNNGPDDATGVVVQDWLSPDQVLQISTPSQGSYNASEGTWKIGNLANGASVTLQLKAKVTTAYPGGPGGKPINIAYVIHSDQCDPDQTNNSAQAGVTPQTADLAVAKTVDDDHPDKGNTITYTVTVSNAGPNSATGVAVSDLLPSGLQFVSATPSVGDFDEESGIWAVGSLSTSAPATLTIQVEVSDCDSHTNTAVVAHSDQFDPNLANNVASIDMTPTSADMDVLTSVDNDNPSPGDTVTFTVDIFNNGPDDATGVVVNDLLPAGLTLVDFDASQGTYDPVSGVWSVGEVIAADYQELTIRAIAGNGSYSNTATIAAKDQCDSVDDNDVDTASVHPAMADLIIRKTTDKPHPNHGDVVTFEVTVTDLGPNNATDVRINDLLPAGLDFLAAQPSAGTYDHTTGVWLAGDIADGGFATLTIQARLTECDPLTNTATITHADQIDPDTFNNSDNVTITPRQADLFVQKEVDNDTPNHGDTITFTIKVTDNGPDDATNVILKDLLPDGLEYDHYFASQGQYDPDSGLWTIAFVGEGQSETLLITAKVEDCDEITNKAEVQSLDQCDENPSNDSDEVTITPQKAELELAKTVDNERPAVGEFVVFTVTLTDNGPDDATHVTVGDFLPPGVMFVSATPSDGIFDSNEGIWSVGSLSAGDSVTLDIRVQVMQSGVWTNRAAIIGSDQCEDEDDQDNNVAIATIYVDSGPALRVFYINDALVNAVGDWTTKPGQDKPLWGLETAMPKRTFQSLLAEYDLGPGDLVEVDTGVYDITSNIVLNKQLQGVTFEGYHEPGWPDRHTTLRRTSTLPGAAIFDLQGAVDITFKNFIFIGGAEAILGVDAGRLTVESNTFSGQADAGVRLSGKSDDALIINNTFTKTGAFGVAINDSGVTLIGNTITGATDTGVFIGPAVGAAHLYDNTIEKNKLYGVHIASPNPVLVGNNIDNNDTNVRIDNPLHGDGSSLQTAAGLITVADIPLAAATAEWQALLGGALPLSVDVSLEALPAGEIAEARITSFSSNGLPATGRIVFDPSAGGVGWFVDPNPLHTAAYVGLPSATSLAPTSNSGAFGHYDLFTAVLHELGHLLGFSAAVPGFASHVGLAAGWPQFVDVGLTARLTADDEHLDASQYPADLMTATLTPSSRRLPSPLDVKIIQATRAASPSSATTIPTGGIDLTSLVGANLVNGDFGVADTSSANFGWTAAGSVAVVQGAAVLTENSQVLSGLSQAFTIPAGVTALQVTLTGINLAANNQGPPDAFEIALVNAATGDSLVGPPGGLANSDALLNIQQTGQTFFAPQVTFAGQTASGAVTPLVTPLVITVDLTGIAPGTAAELFFDLLGFGTVGSSVAIDNVQFVGLGGNQLPVANNDAFSVGEDATLAIGSAAGVLLNDTDADAGDTKSVTTVNGSAAAVGAQITLASGALLKLNSDGSFQYDPNGKFQFLRAGQTTTDSFTYQMSDTQGATATATVTITIQGANDPPLAVNDTGLIDENHALVVSKAAGVLANDTDLDLGDTKNVTAVNGQNTAVGNSIALPSGAVLTMQADGSYSYDPNGKFASLKQGQSATDSFTYTMADGSGATSTATVVVTIQGANASPVANNDSATTGENQVLTVAAAGVLSNDTDADVGDTQTVTAVNGNANGVGAILTLPSGALLTQRADGSYQYDPKTVFDSLRQGQTSTDSYTYTVTDSAGASSTATVTITIQGANDPPVAVNDTGLIDENHALVVAAAAGVLSNDTDLDQGDTKHVSAVNGQPTAVGNALALPSGALLTMQADGSYRYDPNGKFESLKQGQSATDSFSYTISDVVGETSTATVLITIQGANDSPIAVNDSASTGENQVLNVPAAGVLANDTDADGGDTKTVTAVNGNSGSVGAILTLSSGALLTLRADGGYQYDPKTIFDSLGQGQTATDSFAYTVTDSAGASSTATVTITIQGANDRPLAVNDTGLIDEDGVLIVLPGGGVLANDTDADLGDIKTVVALNGLSAVIGQTVTLSSGAELTLQSDGSYQYDTNGQFQTLRAGQTATDSFSYTMTDGQGATSSATVTISILGANDSPLAVNDSASTPSDQILVVATSNSVLNNDTDPDAGDTKTVSAISGSQAAVGTQITLSSGALLTMQADGSYRYDPHGIFGFLKHGQSATDTFTYTMTDSAGADSSAAVTITIQGVNHAPAAKADTYNTLQGIPLTITMPGVLANDTDFDGDTLTATKLTDPASGALVLNANGSFTYTPTANFVGSVSFDYRASDGALNSSATVTIVVSPPNAPVQNPDNYTTPEDIQLVVAAPGVLQNDLSPSGVALTASLVTTTAHGNLIFNADGSFSYAPVHDYNGPDSFVYLAKAGATSSASPATVTISVTSVNDPPTAFNDSSTVAADQILDVSIPGVLANDIDVDVPDTKHVTAINGTASAIGQPFMLPSGAIVTMQADGSYQYDPNGRFAGLTTGQTATDHFDYSMADTAGATSSATVTIAIQPAVPQNSISGSVFLDINNNGSRSPQELGLPGVMVVLQGPVNRVQRTDPHGNYQFEELPAGTYIVWEYHPASFLDGIDTRGAPALGTVANDRFSGIVLSGDMHLANYNFGERGVANPTKAMELASTPSPETLVVAMVLHDEPATLEAQILQSITPPAASPSITKGAVDVDSDGFITATDVLIVINYVNAHSSQRTATLSPSIASLTPTRCDVNGDGSVTASDVLAIINYINAHHFSGEGEADSSIYAGEEYAASSRDNIDLLVDLLASDVAVIQQKKT